MTNSITKSTQISIGVGVLIISAIVWIVTSMTTLQNSDQAQNERINIIAEKQDSIQTDLHDINININSIQKDIEFLVEQYKSN